MTDSFSGDYLARRGSDPEDIQHAQAMAAARRKDMVRMLNDDAREENFGMGVHDQEDQNSAEARLWAERGGAEQLANFASDTSENALQGVISAGEATDQTLRDTAVVGPWYSLIADTTNAITENAMPGLWNASNEWQRRLEADDTENDKMAQMFFQYAIPFAGWMKGFNAVAGGSAAMSKVQLGASAVGADVVTSWTALQPHFERFSQFLGEFEAVNNIPVLNRVVEYISSTDGTDAEERLKNISDSLLAGGLITPVVGGIVGAMKIMRNGYRMAKGGELGMTLPGTNQQGMVDLSLRVSAEDARMRRAQAQGFDTDTVYYRGDFNAAELGDEFDVSKAESGAIYFTDDPEIASSYAKNKPWLPENAWGVIDNAAVQVDGKNYPMREAGRHMTAKQKQKIEDAILSYEIDEGGGAVIGKSTWDDYLRRAGGDHVAAAHDIMMGGGMFIDEREYIEWLDNTGAFEAIRYADPFEGRPGVTPVYLNTKNSLDIYNVTDEQLKAIDDELGGDHVFVKWLRDARDGTLEESLSFVPEDAREALLKLGYDTIKDIGGKTTGGDAHNVVLVLDPKRIRSKHANFDPEKADSANLMHGAAPAGAAATSDKEPKRDPKTGRFVKKGS